MLKTIFGGIALVIILMLVSVFVVGIKSYLLDAGESVNRQPTTTQIRDSLKLENLRLENEQLKLQIKRLAAEENK